jgi:hypothetical protein
LIASPPRLRITKDPKAADDSDFVPKRSARLAAKSKFRAAKPDAQARKVLMKKLGLRSRRRSLIKHPLRSFSRLSPQHRSM